MAVLDEKLSFAVEVRADPIRSSASARAHALSLGSAQADARRTPLASASSDLKILSISGILKSCACAPRPVLFSATLYRPCALTAVAMQQSLATRSAMTKRRAFSRRRLLEPPTRF